MQCGAGWIEPQELMVDAVMDGFVIVIVASRKLGRESEFGEVHLRIGVLAD